MEWDDYFMRLVYAVAQKSKDIHTKVGCVVVGDFHEVKATGYNSFPAGLDDNVPERKERPEKYHWIEHAERNAIYIAARNGISLKGCTIYIQWYPCVECARAIVQSGIKTVVIDNRDSNPWKRRNDGQWDESIRRSLQMFKETGIVVKLFDENSDSRGV